MCFFRGIILNKLKLARLVDYIINGIKVIELVQQLAEEETSPHEHCDMLYNSWCWRSLVLAI